MKYRFKPGGLRKFLIRIGLSSLFLLNTPAMYQRNPMLAVVSVVVYAIFIVAILLSRVVEVDR